MGERAKCQFILEDGMGILSNEFVFSLETFDDEALLTPHVIYLYYENNTLVVRDLYNRDFALSLSNGPRKIHRPLQVHSNSPRDRLVECSERRGSGEEHTQA
jgi:hypothetical protein